VLLGGIRKSLIDADSRGPRPLRSRSDPRCHMASYNSENFESLKKILFYRFLLLPYSLQIMSVCLGFS
jgi:hypothetical protein